MLDAARLYLAREAVQSFGFGLIVNVLGIYYVRTAGLDPLQLVLVGTVLEASYFLCELPTGVLADTVGRKLSVVLGALIIGAAFMAQALVPAFLAIVAFEALRGLGEAFASGAPEAWVSTEIGDDRAAGVFARAAQIGRVGYIGGLAASVPLASVALPLPVVVGGALSIATGLALAVLMPERAFRAREASGSWRDFARTSREAVRVVRARPLLVTILLVELLFGAASEGYDRLWEAHLLRDVGLPSLLAGDAVAWFAILNIGGNLLAIAAIEVVRRRVDTTRHEVMTRLLVVAQGVRIVARLAFAFAPSFAIAAAARWTGGVAAAATGPAYTAWVTRNIEPEVRATVLSASGVANAAGQIAGGPVVGVLGERSGIAAAIAATALILSATPPLFARAGAQAPRVKPGPENPRPDGVSSR